MAHEMFHQGDLQSGIALAVQQTKIVLCFVRDESRASKEWEDALCDISELVKAETVALRLSAGSQEAAFLSSFCPLNSVPTVVLIKNGVVQLHMWAEGAGAVTLEQFKIQVEAALRQPDARHVSIPTLPTATAPSPAHLPPSASPANVVAEEPSAASTSAMPSATPSTRLRPASHIELESASSTAPTAPPVNLGSQAQQSQRSDYIKMQKEREQKQRDERERIKQQIKIDREERRRREGLRKQQQSPAVDSTGNASAASAVSKSREVRVQVRAFDGSTLRQTFMPTANITSDIRPWIDSTSSQPVPYNLKLIMTPLPNRNIEAAEEEQSLVDLEIKGSCTFIMVPVKGYVESYTGSTAGGLLGSAVSGGYNVVAGTAGAVFGGLKSFLGWDGQPDGNVSANKPGSSSAEEDPGQSNQNVRIRTLADQRIEAAKKKDQQFYNGNQLNFEPRKDEGKDD